MEDCSYGDVGYVYGDRPLCEMFTGMGKGIGNMLNALTNPLVLITAGLGIVTGVLALFAGIIAKISKKV